MHVLVPGGLHLRHAPLPLRADILDLRVPLGDIRASGVQLAREAALARLAAGELALEVLDHAREMVVARGRMRGRSSTRRRGKPRGVGRPRGEPGGSRRRRGDHGRHVASRGPGDRAVRTLGSRGQEWGATRGEATTRGIQHP